MNYLLSGEIFSLKHTTVLKTKQVLLPLVFLGPQTFVSEPLAFVFSSYHSPKLNFGSRSTITQSGSSLAWFFTVNM